MRASVALAVVLLLSGCSLAGSISEGSIEYDRALEDVGNAMVVSNILRAKDAAPLHFTDLSQIRGSLQLQLQAQATAPIGQQYDSSTRTRAAFQSTISVSTNPTFDVVPLNTKEFTEGITTPITLKTLRYYMDRFGDYREALGVGETSTFKADLLKLFVEKVVFIPDYKKDQEEYDYFNRPSSRVLISNPPGTPAPECDERTVDTFHLEKAKLLDPKKCIVSFQDIVPELAKRLVLTAEREPFGPAIWISGRDFLRESSRLVANGLDVKRVPDQPGMFQLYKQSTKTALCLEPEQSDPHKTWLLVQEGKLGEPITRTPSERPAQQVCAPDEAAPTSAAGKEKKKKQENVPEVLVYLRSVESVIFYLGQMLNVSDEDARALKFFIRDTDTGRTRFRVLYRDKLYYVNENSGVNDETLLILSIVNQVLNLYKDANEIPTTKAVQSVP
jgi:hypothetical protein